MPSRWLRALSCLLLPAYVSQCNTWQVQTVAPEQVVAEDSPSVVRVTMTDSVEVVLEQPRVGDDSLVGVVRGSDRTTRSVALADISSVAVQHTDPLKSVGLGLAVIMGFMAFFVGIAAISCATNSDPSMVC